jgi:hypothetical protein
VIIVTKYTDVPGWSNFLYIHERLVECLPDNASILEVGVGYGRSTWTLLDNIKSGMNLCVLDEFKAYGSNNAFFQHFIEYGCNCTLDAETIKKIEEKTHRVSQKRLFLHFIKQHPSYSKLKMIYNITSNEYIDRRLTSNYDLVFLDGCHDYNVVNQELNFFKNCKVIAVHDYKNEFTPGVAIAVDEFLIQNPDRKFAYDKDNLVFIIYQNDVNFNL